MVEFWWFSSSPCWTLSWSCFISTRFFLWFPCSSPTSPPLSLQAHCCAPFIFYSLLQCVFSDGTGIIPKCFALLSAGAQPGTSAEVAVHLQELSLKGLRMKQAKPGNTECCGAETSVPRLEGTESVMLNSASAIGFMHLFFAYQDQLAGGAWKQDFYWLCWRSEC